MNKTLVAIACAAALLVASNASAQDVQLTVVGEAGVTGEGVVNATTADADAPVPTLYTEGQPIQIRGQAGIRPPLPPRPAVNGITPVNGIQRVEIQDLNEIGKDLPPNPPRKTNREIIEYVRKLKAAAEQEGFNADRTLEPRFDGAGGTASGQVRLFRASTTTGGTPGQFVRTIAASGSRAIFLRDSSSTAGVRLGNFFGPVNFSGRVISSTTADGNALFTFEQKRPPVREFMDQIFNLFRKVGGQQ